MFARGELSSKWTVCANFGVGKRAPTVGILEEVWLPSMNDHEYYMRRAIELATQVPELPFGAVIVDGNLGVILAEGWNQTSLNPILHGEIDAIHRLVARGSGFARQNLILYTTAEPCPMCQGAILWSGIATVVFGTSIPTLQRLGWRQIDIRAEEVIRRSPAWTCTLVGGVLERECDALFEQAAAWRS